MKPITSFILFLALSFFATSTLQAKEKKENGVYAFAVGSCLNDTVVYISAISPLDSATVNHKTNFLQDRQLYSYQFKMFLDLTYSKSHTCSVFYSTKKEALEKKYVKIRHRYNKKEKDVRFVEVPADQFKFVNINKTE